MKPLLEALLFPPGLIVLLAVTGVLLLSKRRRVGVGLLGGAVIALYVLSLPVTASAVMALLQAYPALAPSDIRREGAQAIVVLAGGRVRNAPEYGGDTLPPLALERLRYGVRLQRQTRLPLILAGGSPGGFSISEASLMRDAATNDFGVPVMLTEDLSKTTWENAVYSAALLRKQGIQRIYLVTHAWHMPRALWSFEQSGIEVIPAPTGFVSVELNRLSAWLPSSSALTHVRLAMHEGSGLLWYRLREYSK